MKLVVFLIAFIFSTNHVSADSAIESGQSELTHENVTPDFNSEVQLLKNNKFNEAVDLNPANLNNKWKAGGLSKEPGHEEYSVTVYRDKLWKHLIVQRNEDKFSHIKIMSVDKLAPLTTKNYWYDGPAKILETDGRLEFFQNEKSKAIKLNTDLKGPFEDSHRWVIMAESSDAFVGRRLDPYGEGSLYYFSKKNSKGRHLYLAFRMPIDPKMRFELRLDSEELKTFDLKTGKSQASGKFPRKVRRQSTAISKDGEQLIAHTEWEFFVVKLNHGKMIEIGPPRSFLENGIPQKVQGVAFTNDGKPVVLSENGILRVYNR